MSNANAKTQTQSDTDTRTLCNELTTVINQLAAQVKTISLEEKVEIGSVLWTVGDAIDALLQAVKSDLRDEAATQLHGGVGTVAFDGTDLGTASVNIPKATLRVPKGKDMLSIKSAIGADFALFFEEVHTFKPRPEFEIRVPSLKSPLHQQILLDSVEAVEPTPRVSFRRNPLPKGMVATSKSDRGTAAEIDVAALLDD